MPLNITINEIQILNSAGQVKFTNNQPLLFVAGYESGSYSHFTTTVSSVYGPIVIFGNTIPIILQTPIESNEIPIVYLTITSASGWGDPVTALVGVRQPANAVLPIYVRGYPQGNTPASDTTQLSFTPTYNNSNQITSYYSRLFYYAYNGGDMPALFNGTQQGLSNPTLNVTWEIYKYRYLED